MSTTQKLRELLKKATPAPWVSEGWASKHESPEDADLIAEMRNNIEALLDIAEDYKAISEMLGTQDFGEQMLPLIEKLENPK